LLEGKFTSLYKNRLPQIENNKEFNFKEQCVEDNAMIVIADGNIIRNDVNEARQEYYPLGYDRKTRTKYANDDFILNCINYLTDDKGLIEARNKEFKIRLLDKQKIQEDESFWKYLNLVGPLLLLVLFGWAQHILRKKKYTTTKH
jgi:gliding-associated putative ABC transporter substrate-binding component GldG